MQLSAHSSVTLDHFVLQDCQQGADQLFLLSLAVPVFVLIAFLAWKLRPVPKTEDSNFFEDSDTGASLFHILCSGA